MVARSLQVNGSSLSTDRSETERSASAASRARIHQRSPKAASFRPPLTRLPGPSHTGMVQDPRYAFQSYQFQYRLTNLSTGQAGYLGPYTRTSYSGGDTSTSKASRCPLEHGYASTT